MKLTTTNRLASIPFFLILFAAGNASGGCPGTIGTDCGGGTAWFGLRWDGANIAQGQSFLLSCESLLSTVEIRVDNSGTSNSGVPPMVQGDPIHCTIVDLGWIQYGTATSPMPFDVGNDWMTFDFEGLDLKLAPGTYVLLVHTEVPRWASIEFCTADFYSDGVRYSSLNGLEGPWFTFADLDIPFRVTTQDNPVPVQSTSWGGVKSLFR